MIPLVLQEAGSERARQLLAADPSLVFWWGAPVECYGAIVRAGRASRLSNPGIRQSQTALASLWGRSAEIGPSANLRAQALRLVAVHPLRGADALQLAAAIVWREERPDNAGFVCLDDRLRAAAMREGFDVMPWPDEVHEGE